MFSSRISSQNSLRLGNRSNRRTVFRKAGRRLMFPNLLCVLIVLVLLCSVSPVVSAPMSHRSLWLNFTPPSRTGLSVPGEKGNTHLRMRSHLPYREARLITRDDAEPPFVPPVLSLARACRKEIHLYCDKSEPHSLQCLLKHYYSVQKNDTLKVEEVYSELCHGWLNARESCVSLLRREWGKFCGDEGDAINVRECLRRIPPPLLSKSCRQSDYYHSVRLAGKLRQRLLEHDHGSVNMFTGKK